MIGVFGGTFNPIHFGHLRCAVEVKDLFGLEQVRLIPNAQPPHRELPSALPLQRAEMLEIAIRNHAGLLCDRRELERQLKSPDQQSYMLDTLVSLRADYPEQPLLLFIGNDAFNHLTRWHQWQRLFDYAHIVVITRPGWQVQVLADFFLARLAGNGGELRQSLGGKLFFQAVTPLDISATAIRDSIAKHHDPSFLLPDAVIEYIRQHKLYQASE
jgi:nicotinate-nucleotide adenylyltransferase